MQGFHESERDYPALMELGKERSALRSDSAVRPRDGCTRGKRYVPGVCPHGHGQDLAWRVHDGGARLLLRVVYLQGQVPSVMTQKTAGIRPFMRWFFCLWQFLHLSLPNISDASVDSNIKNGDIFIHSKMPYRMRHDDDRE